MERPSALQAASSSWEGTLGPPDPLAMVGPPLRMDGTARGGMPCLHMRRAPGVGSAAMLRVSGDRVLVPEGLLLSSGRSAGQRLRGIAQGNFARSSSVPGASDRGLK